MAKNSTESKKKAKELELERAHKLLELMLGDKMIACHLEACIGKDLIPQKGGGLMSVDLRIARRNQEFLEKIADYCDLVWMAIEGTDKTGEIFDNPEDLEKAKKEKEEKLAMKLRGRKGKAKGKAKKSEPAPRELEPAAAGDGDTFDTEWEG